MIVALVVLAWLAGVVLAALAVRAAPEPSSLDTQLDGVDQPESALQPTRDAAQVDHSDDEQPCWPVYGRSARRTSDAADLDVGVPRRRTWARRIGIMEFPPSYCDGVLYVNNQHGDTFAINARNAKTIWKRRTARIYDSTPAISGDRIFVGSFEPATVQALDRATGRRLWTLRAGGPVESSPVVVDGIVYATSKDRRVYALDEATGRVRWAFRTGGEVKDSPSVNDGMVYVGNYAAEVFALDARTGRVRWRRAVGGVRGDRIYASIPIGRTLVFAATVRGAIHAFDARNGETRWQTEIPGYVYATPALSDGRLFVGNYQGEIHAFDTRSGRSLWKRTLGGTFSGSPTVIGRNVYVSSLSGTRTWALDARTGRTRWEHADGRYVSGIATSDALYMSMGSTLSRWVD